MIPLSFERRCKPCPRIGQQVINDHLVRRPCKTLIRIRGPERQQDAAHGKSESIFRGRCVSELVQGYPPETAGIEFLKHWGRATWTGIMKLKYWRYLISQPRALVVCMGPPLGSVRSSRWTSQACETDMSGDGEDDFGETWLWWTEDLDWPWSSTAEKNADVAASANRRTRVKTLPFAFLKAYILGFGWFLLRPRGSPPEFSKLVF